METRTESRDGWIEVAHGGVHVLAKGDEHLRERLRSALADPGEDHATDLATDELTADGVRRAPDFAIVDEPGGRVLVRGRARVVVTDADGTIREFVAPVRAPWSDEDLLVGAAAAVLVPGEDEEAARTFVADPLTTPEAAAEERASLDRPGEDEVSDAPVVPERSHFVDGHLVSHRVPMSEPAPAVAAVDDGPAEPAEPAADPFPMPVPEPVVDPVPAPVLDPVPETHLFRAEPTGPGSLRLPTGDRVPLDRTVLLGRAPRVPADQSAESDPHLVRVTSPDNEISRTHVEVRAEGARVLVRDLGSTNGTTLARPGEPPLRLAPGEQQAIEAGTTITLAGRVVIVLEAD